MVRILHNCSERTSMTKDLHIAPILEAFSMDKDCLAVPFGSGHINDTFRIATTEKAYILQRINHQVFRDPAAVMQNIAATGKFLKQTTYPLQVLLPLETKDGSPFFKDQHGDFWRLFPFIQYAHSFDEVPDTDYAFKAAKAFGDFIAGLKDFDAFDLTETIPGFHNGAQRWVDFEKAVTEDRMGRKKEVVEILDRIHALENLRFLVNYSYQNNKMQIRSTSGEILPVRAIHHDTKINNVVFHEETGEALCVIDLDTLMPGTVLSDFGDMVRTFIPTFNENEKDASKITVRLDIFEAMVRGFLKATGSFLTGTEKKHLLDGGKYITFIQVIRFLGDYLNGDLYYKTHYAGQNLDRARNQLSLLESVLQQETEMERIIMQSGE